MDEATQAALAQLLGLGGLEEEQSLLQEELARAEALRGQTGPYYGATAGILGGLGDAIRNIASYTTGAGLSKTLRGNLAEQKAARKALGPAVLGSLGLGGSLAPAPMATAPLDFSLGG